MSIIDEYCKVNGNILEPYSCILNQTDIESNKNKFYIMQIIETKSSFEVFVRYGRIGEPGKTLTDSYKNKSDAIAWFVKQFKNKTSNTFGETFVKKSGKYFLSEMEKPEIDDKDDKNEKKDTEKNIKNEDDDLDERLKFFLDLISNEKMLNDTLIKLNVDPKKMPLGKISSGQLEKANNILTQIKDIIDKFGKSNNDDKKEGKKNKFVLDKESISKINELSSEYYTLVPYSCGRSKPPCIDNSELVDNNSLSLEELKNIHITYTIIKKTTGNINRLTNVNSHLDAKVSPLNKDDIMYNELVKYVANTQAPTHNCKLKVIDIYEVQKNTDKIYDEFTKNMDNKILLLHGSSVSNWCSIVKNGLLLDPSKLGVKITGKMFGYGIYWANSISKSFNYCNASSSDNTAVLAVAEVCLGNIYEQYASNYNISQVYLDNLGKNSTWGRGQSTPESETKINGVSIPNGKLKKNDDGKQYSLLYDEFIIYNTNQYKIKYLLVVKNEI
jgi:poly [ADP-ribose] polymerase